MRDGKKRPIPKKYRGRCSGHCCSCFYLPFSPEEIEAAYTRWVSLHGKPGQHEPISMSQSVHQRGASTTLFVDVHLVFPMLIYLGQGGNLLPRQVRPVGDDDDDDDDVGKAHYYSCVHWDQRTGNCQIYEHRPQMCREYPYSECNYSACTWTKRKAKPETARERRRREDGLVQIGRMKRGG